MSYSVFFKSIARLYLYEKITLNSTRIARLRNIQKHKIIIYLAPSDFNSLIKKEIVPDKAHELFCILRKMGFYPVYLVRYSLNSPERLTLKSIYKNKSILQVRINLFRLFVGYLDNKWRYFKESKAKSNIEMRESALSHFMNNSLLGMLKEIDGLFILSIGANQELLTIAHKLGIKVIEIMHGIIDGNQVQKDWGHPSQEKPDLVMTWNDYYTKILCESNVNAVTIGYPQHNFTKSRKTSSHKIRILITLGHGEPDSSDPFGATNKKLLNQIKQIMTGDVKIIFRIHPVISADPKKLKGLNKWLKREFLNSEIHSPKEFTLFESLECADIHLSKYSSTFFEAALCGIPTIFTEEVSDLILPQVVLDSKMIIQGGNLNITDITKLAAQKFTSPFEFMEDTKFKEIITKVLRD